MTRTLFGLFAYCTIYFFFAFPCDAHAYLDPGTGSMLLSVIVGLLSSAFFAVRRLPTAARSLLFRLRGQSVRLERTPIVMYAESAAYWTTFRPLLEECGRRGKAVLYLTSDEKDPVFDAGLPECITARFIGVGNTAYTALNFLEADVFVLTTPGIDVLQIRRSRGVGKYIHVVHAPGDMHLNKIYSFDFYDVVLCSGPHQVRSLRALEGIRHTKPKRLPLAGCPYYDVQAARYQSEGSPAPEPGCILLAPSWSRNGRNGILAQTGATIPKMLVKAGFKVVFRPHPQSYISEKPLMEQLRWELSEHPDIVWDKSPDGFASMSKAQLMISDLSGISRDFAFIFERPVITVKIAIDPEMLEAFDLPFPPRELEILDDIGKGLEVEDIARIPAIIQALQNTLPDVQERIRKLRESYIVNFGHSSGPIVDEICHMVDVVERDANHAAHTVSAVHSAA